MVIVVEMKQSTAQKLTQPTVKDLEESLKKVLLGSGQGRAWEVEPLELPGDSVGGSVGVVARPTPLITMRWELLMQFSVGNLSV